MHRQLRIGWEIDIDKPAMERFAKIPGEFGERLRSAIHGGEQPTFALASGDRCALLREDGSVRAYPPLRGRDTLRYLRAPPEVLQ